MRRMWSAFAAVLAVLSPTIVFAEEAVKSYSRGNAMMYFSLIAAILIFGVHDVFHKKWLTWAAAVVLPLFFYLSLPAK